MMAYHFYYKLHLLFQTCSTKSQPSANPLNNSTLSNWLAPTPRKSYKMFFQMVTRSLPTSHIIFIGAIVYGFGAAKPLLRHTHLPIAQIVVNVTKIGLSQLQQQHQQHYCRHNIELRN